MAPAVETKPECNVQPARGWAQTKPWVAAFRQFAEPFMQRGNDGNVITSSEGDPVFRKEFDLALGHIVDAYHDTEIAYLESRIAANQFPSHVAKEHTEMTLSALRWVKSFKAGEEGNATQAARSQSEEHAEMFEHLRETFAKCIDEKELMLHATVSDLVH
jgi:hypothetical protein